MKLRSRHCDDANRAYNRAYMARSCGAQNSTDFWVGTSGDVAVRYGKKRTGIFTES